VCALLISHLTILCAALSFFAPATASAAPPPSGWNELLVYEFATAGETFVGDAPNARLGQALTLLGTQPKTAGNIARAEDLLRALAAESPRSDPGLTARYFLARIAQLHAFTPDPDRAVEHYETLIALAPDHPLAQLGTVKLIVLQLHDPALTTALRREQSDSFAARAMILPDPAARRDAALALADVALRLDEDPRRALVLLQRADAEACFAREATQANVWFQIMTLAHELGDNTLADATARRFLDRFLRDPRRMLVGRYLLVPAPSP